MWGWGGTSARSLLKNQKPKEGGKGTGEREACSQGGRERPRTEQRDPKKDISVSVSKKKKPKKKLHKLKIPESGRLRQKRYSRTKKEFRFREGENGKKGRK